MTKKKIPLANFQGYERFVTGIQELIAYARRQSARSVNVYLTASSWETGRRIVEYEQGGEIRAGYGQALLVRLSADLTPKFGRGYSVDSLEQMRRFYLAWPPAKISETLSRKLPSIPAEQKSETLSRKLTVLDLKEAFRLSWSQYVLLLSVRNPQARDFYEKEALRADWSVRQLGRQIESQFYERLLLSRNKAAMLAKGSRTQPDDHVRPEEEIKDPHVLEFLGLKDEYSEIQLEEALIHHLESFLLELGDDFTFVARQKRLRVGDTWYRVDLVFFHRRLRSLILADLKIGSLTHADAGQMHLYLNYAKEHWMRPGENPPVGLILCSKKNEAVAHYALENLPNKVLASEYRMTLPKEEELAAELEQTQKVIETRLLVRTTKKFHGDNR